MTTTSYGESAAELNLATFQAREEDRSSTRDAEAAGDDDVDDRRIERIMVGVVVVVVAPCSFLSSLCGKQTEGRKIFLLTSESVIHEQDLSNTYGIRLELREKIPSEGHRSSVARPSRKANPLVLVLLILDTSRILVVLEGNATVASEHQLARLFFSS
jgi:hypothetical protein